MVVIFIVLYIWAKYYAPIEKQRSKLEAEIFEKFIKVKSGELKIDQDLLEKSRNYFKNPNLKAEDLNQLIFK